jgi:hypothetical protein
MVDQAAVALIVFAASRAVAGRTGLARRIAGDGEPKAMIALPTGSRVATGSGNY